ncbi:hypothetical protein ACN47E_009707 [Coniothyrium glycines]
MPLPSGPHRPFVLTFVGVAGGDDDGVGVGVAIGVGVDDGRGLEEGRNVDELGIVPGIEDDDMGGETPLPQFPNALRQPVPQNSILLPQKYHSLQQEPKTEPLQVVTLPHWPFVETMSVLDGSGGNIEEMDEAEAVVDEGIVLIGFEDVEGVGAAVGSGGAALPHRPKAG